MSPKYPEKDLISLGWLLRKGLSQTEISGVAPQFACYLSHVACNIKVCELKIIGCVPIPYFCYALSTLRVYE